MNWKSLIGQTPAILKAALLLFFLDAIAMGCQPRPPASDPTSVPTSTFAPVPPDAGATTLTPVPIITAIPALSGSLIFHVSKSGNNTDGRSPETAWNELDQIQWDRVQPGDTIVISGGEYHTQLKVRRSGEPGAPITITTNGEPVILNGQRPAPPYCGQADYVSIPGDDGVDFGDHGFIVLDGRDWRGIVVKNHARGIKIRPAANNIIVRNVEIHDNGYASGTASNSVPDGVGVRLGGSNILFERVIIHDNGQDAFQSGWGVWNFTLRRSWLYNSREHPLEKGRSFNYCSHTDGLQIYDGGTQGPVVIEDTIIGPSFTQGIIIGNLAVVNDALIRNTLIVGNDNSGIVISDGGTSSGWTLQNVTIAQNSANESWNFMMTGTAHRIKDSIFWGGSWGMGILNWTEASGNFHWLTPDTHEVAVEIDPMFLDDEYALTEGEGFADFDFTAQNPALPNGTGSAITSVRQLLDATPNE